MLAALRAEYNEEAPPEQAEDAFKGLKLMCVSVLICWLYLPTWKVLFKCYVWYLNKRFVCVFTWKLFWKGQKDKKVPIWSYLPVLMSELPKMFYLWVCLLENIHSK